MIQPQGSRWRTSLVIVSLCIAVVAASAAWRSPAALTSAPAAPPTAIGIVNLKTLFNGLTEYTEGMALIDGQTKVSTAKLDDIKKQLKTLQTEMEALKDPPMAKRLELAQKVAELKALGKARAATLTEVLEYSAGDMLRRIFLKAVKATDALAKKDGYDVILIDDRDVVPPETTKGEDGGDPIPLKMSQVERIIQQRHIMVANDRVDVTAALITLMNAEYKAGKK
jgi:Skp family chaperone for outer membrane proteins